APTSCGLLDHFNCDSLTHVEEQCTITNSNGERCTYMFWRCGNLTHTHAYPTPPPPPPPSATCARQACGQTVSDRLEHRIDCGPCNGHYWTCISGAADNHTTTFTCRRPGCGVSFTRCSNGSCTSDWGTHNYHWASD
ncbi:hypothetical protein J4G08_17235, partial [Candidatus Poribacteria bacterium]|nr:hypothetical protein [Candidatus Poribacteria bacterium]